MRTLIGALSVLGCATPLSASHTAEVVPWGHLEVSLATGTNFPIGASLREQKKAEQEASTLIQDLQSKHSVTLSPSDVYVVVGAGLTLGDLPALVTEVIIRYGVAPRMDLGLRFTGTAWRGEVFGQIYDGDRWKVAGGLGAAWRGFDQGVVGTLDDFGVLSFSETDIDATVLAGRKWSYGAFYAGPKAVLSLYSASGSVLGQHNTDISVLGAQIDSSVPISIDVSHSWLVGGVIGGRAGYKHIWAFAELAAYQSFYTPSILGVQARLGGLVVYPTAGITGTF